MDNYVKWLTEDTILRTHEDHPNLKSLPRKKDLHEKWMSNKTVPPLPNSYNPTPSYLLAKTEERARLIGRSQQLVSLGQGRVTLLSLCTNEHDCEPLEWIHRVRRWPAQTEPSGADQHEMCSLAGVDFVYPCWLGMSLWVVGDLRLVKLTEYPWVSDEVFGILEVENARRSQQTMFSVKTSTIQSLTQVKKAHQLIQ